jgi:hypothetical protein
MRIPAKFLRLSGSERRLVIRALGTLVAIKTALVLGGFSRLRDFLADDSHAIPSARPEIARIIWSVEAVSGRIPGLNNCLVRALAAQYLLNQFGYRSELKIGVARAGAGGLTAHAWLESEGKPIIGGALAEDYVPLAASESIRRAAIR